LCTALAQNPFGGNMDVPDVKPGNTIYLPVWNEGALFYTVFYTGYCHARQEQVERCGVALEITSKVTVVFEGEKMKAVPSST
jgi:amidase